MTTTALQQWPRFGRKSRSIAGWAVRRWTACALAGIVAAAMLLSTYWVFLVPVYQAADEFQHLDYAFTLHSAGRLLNVRERSSEGVVLATHPASAYLTTRTRAYTVVFHPEVRMPAEYGTPAYFRALDRDAPTLPAEWLPQKNPVYLGINPFGYYALLALWLGLLDGVSDSLIVLYFGARFFSVLLLGASLLLLYGIMRELRVRPWQRLLLVALVGSFPLTSFMSSYVQPDNLSLTLVSLALYAALLARREPARRRVHLVLGGALALLMVTKYQYWFCVLVPVLAMLVTQRLTLPPAERRWRLLGGALLAPALALGALQLWVMWEPNLLQRYLLRSRVASPAASGPSSPENASGSDALLAVPRRLAAVFSEFYLGGETAAGFWRVFGWMDTRLVIGSAQTSQLVGRLLSGATVIVFVLTLARLAGVAARLARVARRGRGRVALRLACANPVLNSHFLFTAFLFGLSVLSPYFVFQGRYWFPFLLSGFLTGTSYAPRAVRDRRLQSALTLAVLLGLALYCAVGGYWAIETLQRRYYVD